MTDRAKFEQMLEYLINEDKEKAEELFHELVVAKSREIYENLLDDDIQVEEVEDEEEDEEVEESFGLGEIGGDATDDFLGDVEASDEEGDEEGADEFGGADDFDGGDEGGSEPATKDDVLDIKDALDDLKAEFEAMLAGEDSDDGEEETDGDDDFGSDDDFGGEEAEDDEETQEGYVREYVEKVPAGHGTEKKGAGETAGVNAKSTVAGKNDMGGTTANIARGGAENGVEAGKGQLKGSSLIKQNAQDLKSGNVNVPGSKTATKLSGVAKGHGAEKKGAGETGVDAKSIIGSRK